MARHFGNTKITFGGQTFEAKCVDISPPKCCECFNAPPAETVVTITWAADCEDMLSAFYPYFACVADDVRGDWWKAGEPVPEWIADVNPPEWWLSGDEPPEWGCAA